MDCSRFAPDFSLALDGRPVPAELRASILSVQCKTGYDGLDEVEVTLANEKLRWLDSDLLKLGTGLTLKLGYAPDPLTQVFDGEVVARGASFPSGGAPTFAITAHDRRHKMTEGNKLRWFAIPIPFWGTAALNDFVTANMVTLENLMVPVIDPVGLALSILLGGVDAFVAYRSESGQKVVRKQANTSDYDFLKQIAEENGWDMRVAHDGALGGHMLHFTSSLDHLQSDFTLRYGSSLIDFSPRVSTVGQIASVSGFVWIAAIKTTFIITLGFDLDRMALTLSIYPGIVPIGMPASDYLIDEPLTLTSLPRRLVVGADTQAQQSADRLGFDRRRCPISRPEMFCGSRAWGRNSGVSIAPRRSRTRWTRAVFGRNFDARKEIWFGSIPPSDQGAIPVRLTF